MKTKNFFREVLYYTFFPILIFAVERLTFLFTQNPLIAIIAATAVFILSVSLALAQGPSRYYDEYEKLQIIISLCFLIFSILLFLYVSNFIPGMNPWGEIGWSSFASISTLLLIINSYLKKDEYIVGIFISSLYIFIGCLASSALYLFFGIARFFTRKILVMTIKIIRTKSYLHKGNKKYMKKNIPILIIFIFLITIILNGLILTSETIEHNIIKYNNFLSTRDYLQTYYDQNHKYPTSIEFDKFFNEHSYEIYFIPKDHFSENIHSFQQSNFIPLSTDEYVLSVWNGDFNYYYEFPSGKTTLPLKFKDFFK